MLKDKIYWQNGKHLNQEKFFTNYQILKLENLPNGYTKDGKLEWKIKCMNLEKWG